MAEYDHEYELDSDPVYSYVDKNDTMYNHEYDFKSDEDVEYN